MIGVSEWKERHCYVCDRACKDCFYCGRINSIAYACALASKETGTVVRVMPRQGSCNAFESVATYRECHSMRFDECIQARKKLFSDCSL